MGVAANRRRQFLVEHPLCCYCCGQAKAETEDHNPARKFFPVGSWPAGFVFPACHACNDGKRTDESLAAEVLNSFNLNEPVDEKHALSMVKRTKSFLGRDEEFRRILFDGIDAHPAGEHRIPFQLPDRFQMAVHNVGMRLFQALHYGLTGRVVTCERHILVRITSNCGMADEGGAIRNVIAQLDKFVPETANQSAPKRFGWGAKQLDGVGMAVAAEVAGSVVWLGFVLDGEPNAELKSRFAWYSGTGVLQEIGGVPADMRAA